METARGRKTNARLARNGAEVAWAEGERGLSARKAVFQLHPSSRMETLPQSLCGGREGGRERERERHRGTVGFNWGFTQIQYVLCSHQRTYRVSTRRPLYALICKVCFNGITVYFAGCFQIFFPYTANNLGLGRPKRESQSISSSFFSLWLFLFRTPAHFVKKTDKSLQTNT